MANSFLDQWRLAKPDRFLSSFVFCCTCEDVEPVLLAVGRQIPTIIPQDIARLEADGWWFDGISWECPRHAAAPLPDGGAA